MKTSLIARPTRQRSGVEIWDSCSANVSKALHRTAIPLRSIAAGEFVVIRRDSMEEKIAKWTSRVVGGSYIAVALIVLSLMAIPKIMNGDILEGPFLIKALIIGILYMASVFLVATLPGKTTKRRAISWVTSIAFHSGLLIYLGVFNDWGSVAFIIGMVETIILILSAIGLGLLVHGHYKFKSV